MEDWKKLYTITNTDLFRQLATSVIIIFVLWIAHRVIVSVLDRKVHNIKSRYTWKKTISYIFVSMGVFLVGRVWFEGIQSLATFFGLLSAGLAIALKDLVANFAGWIFIIWRRPFEVGNRIQIGDKSGDVIDLRPFQFTILEIGNWVKADQSTGRIIHIPNGLMFTQPLTNYDQGFKYIWNEIPVLITFESNWQKTKKILLEIVNKNAMQLTGDAEEQIKQAAR